MVTTQVSQSSAEAQDSTRRVFSGIQPSGEIHLGNYLGAVKQWVEHQGERINYFCIVDLHAITVPQDPATLEHQTRSLAAMLLACGIDPKKSTLFVQGHVAAHSEATWLLNCVTPLGWLERMTQYKDKAAKQESISTGLLDYPVLMAADILLYDAHEVPVGEDQKQHVELTRDIAQRFNHLYGETFVVPEPVIPQTAARVMGLDDPTVKMSKTFSHVRGHAVRLLDEPKEMERAIMRAVTDSGSEIAFSDDPAKAGVNNLLGIYVAITGKTPEETMRDFADARGYGDLKRRVAEVVVETLSPIRERHNQLMQDPAELDRLLAIGAEQARAYAAPKVEQMKRGMGLTVG
ncbi:MAG TPA: tryptophan--tRNA ligase [Dehalococcoidia bacterium]|jgi:tryptophanyl-tRNA synthetase|nr:tryptophan--tRNA ligase [Dehalococcoidia bacterium]